jgi:glycerophosphoryl diester phosphodiesterase
MAAFDRAFALGARAIELDVRASDDGEIVVVHDRDLERVTNGHDPRPVDALEWAELRVVDLGGGARIPRLAEVLDWCGSQGVAVNVEVKHDGRHRRALVRGLARLVAHARVDVLLSSFDPRLLGAIGLLARGIPRAWLVDPKESPPLEAMALFARPPLAHALHPRRDQITRGLIERCHRRGANVGVYTVNDEGDAKQLANDGVDWLITDRPAEFLRLFSHSQSA